MLGEPIAAIAEPVDMLRKLDRLAQRIGGSHPLTHRRLIEDAEFRGQRVWHSDCCYASIQPAEEPSDDP
jgi:hypothetical protein